MPESYLNHVLLTIDYETWHPIPKGKEINWNKDIFEPTESLLKLFNEENVSVSFFIEMGEYIWLKENMPEVAAKFSNQLKKIVSLGHDIQLHLHPNWLPEFNPLFEKGTWSWDWNFSKIGNYPWDINELILKLKLELQSIGQVAIPGYKVTTFRAGAYQAQPFPKLFDALINADFKIDSSCFNGGVSAERGYNYKFMPSHGEPFFAERLDLQLPSSNTENKLVEIPIFTKSPDQRLSLDGRMGKKFGKILYKLLKNKQSKKNINNYFVIIGHTKTDLDYKGIKESIRLLKTISNVKFSTFNNIEDHVSLDAANNTQALASTKFTNSELDSFLNSDTHQHDFSLLMTKKIVNLSRFKNNITYYSENASENIQDIMASDMVIMDFNFLKFDKIILSTNLMNLSKNTKVLFVDNGYFEINPLVYQEWLSIIPKYLKEKVIKFNNSIYYYYEYNFSSFTEKIHSILDWLYIEVSPSKNNISYDPKEIIQNKHAWCAGYSICLASILNQLNMPSRLIHIYIKDHPRGRGTRSIDTHTMVEVFHEGKWMLVDPTCSIYYENLTIENILQSPNLTTDYAVKMHQDPRFIERGYDLYTSELIFRNVVNIKRTSLNSIKLKAFFKKTLGR